MKYSEQRIPTLNEYCVVCDEQHVFQNGSMLKVSQKRDNPVLIWIILIIILFHVFINIYNTYNSMYIFLYTVFLVQVTYRRACKSCSTVFVQPAVCTRELCVFSFYTLGVMSGAAEEVATGAEVTISL